MTFQLHLYNDHCLEDRDHGSDHEGIPNTLVAFVIYNPCYFVFQNKEKRKYVEDEQVGTR